MLAARLLSGFGKTLVGAGAIILLFAAYQLWGTGLQERRSQGDLTDAFAQTLAQVSAADLDRLTTTTVAPTVGTTPPAPTTTAPPSKELLDLLYPAEGSPVAVLRIPKIGLEKVVVEGTATEDLKRGPGRYMETPLPGQPGNAAIAGHRTTYGAPFFDLDQLAAGDEIRVTNVLGDVVYEVEGTLVVDPTDVEVVGDYGDNRITLTACHPKYSAAKRIVVWGRLVGEPRPAMARPVSLGDDQRAAAPGPTTAAVPTTAATNATVGTAMTGPLGTGAGTADGVAFDAGPDDAGPDDAGPDDASGATISGAAAGLTGDGDAWPAAIAWGLVSAAIAFGAWFVGRSWERRTAPRRFRRLTVHVLASPLFLVALYYCFVHVDRLLPAI